MSLDLLPQFVRDNYECHEWRHACAVLREDFRSEWDELIEVIEQFRLRRSEVSAAGKNKSPISRGVDQQLYQRGWVEKKFDTKIVIDDQLIDFGKAARKSGGELREIHEQISLFFDLVLVGNIGDFL